MDPGSSSSSEDVRAASEDRLLAPARPWVEARSELLASSEKAPTQGKKSSVGGRRKLREEQRRREEKQDNSKKYADDKRVSLRTTGKVFKCNARWCKTTYPL